MGWRERDSAKWSNAQRQSSFGTTRSTSRAPTRYRPRAVGKRRTWRETLGALILVAAAVAYYSGALNHSAQRTITGPTPAPPSPRYTTMSGPSSVPRGTYMTVTGTLPSGESGPIIVEGRWRYALPRPGIVHVRLALPDGDYDVETIDVT